MLRQAHPLLTALASLLIAASAASAQQFQFNGGGGGFQFNGGNLGGFGDQPAAEPESFVETSAQWSPATDDQPAMIAVTAKIAPGYHLYSITQQAGGPLRSKLTVEGATLAGPWTSNPGPKVHVDQEIYGDLPLEEHYDAVTWRAPITLSAGADQASVRIAGTLVGQACTETTCNPVNTTFTAEPVAAGVIPAPAVSQPQQSPAGAAVISPAAAVEAASLSELLPTLGAAFLGGLILNLMPCVLPVIGLKVLSFAEQAGHNRAKVLAMNLAYTAGLLSVFLWLACLTAFAGYGWGQLNTHAEYRIGMTVFVFAMALSFLGVWEIPLPGFAGGKVANDLQQKEGYSGAFAKGVFTTILATPCSGPFLGPAIGYTLAQPPLVTFLIFMAIGVGMASPYLLIGAFPSLVKALPKPGAWMETFKQLMGFVMMGTALYFLFWVIVPENQKPVAITLLAVALACWWIGRTPLTASASQRSMAWLGGWSGAALVGVVAFTQLGAAADQAQTASHGKYEHELAWTPFSSTALDAAKGEGKTILVDFTANWCPTCQLNSQVAINTQRVKQVVEANDVTPMLADWTNANDDIKQTLESLGSRSIPFLAIFPAGKPDQPILLPDLITEDQLLKALMQAGAVRENGASIGVPEIEIGDLNAASPSYR